MTQAQALAASVSSGRKLWKLEIFDPLGKEELAVYTTDNPGPIVGGFVSTRFPNNTCGPLKFEARPDQMIAPPRSIVKLSYDTGSAIVHAHYGVLTTNPPADSRGRGVYESSSGKELLKNSYCSGLDESYALTPIDAANWLRYLVGLYKHPALKYDFSGERMPPTGVMIGALEFQNLTLYEVIQGVVKSIPTLSEDDWGVDPEGYVVVRPPTGETELPYAKVSAQWKRGPTLSTDTCTLAVIRVANKPSEGVITSAAYKPMRQSYYYEHPAHAAYIAPRSFQLPKRDDGTPIFEVLRRRATTDLNPNGWTNPQNLSDDNEATFATSNADAEITAFQTSSSYVTTAGAEAIIDAAAGNYTISLGVAYYLQGQTPSFAFAYRPISEIKGQGKVLVRVPIPPARVPSGQKAQYAAAYLKITGTANGLVKLHELRLLELNTTLLSQIAQSNIRLPASEVQEITLARGFVGEEGSRVAVGGFLLETPTRYFKVPDAPDVNGKTKVVQAEMKEIIDTFNTEEDQLSRVALGDKIRSPRTRAIQDAILRARQDAA